MKRSGRFQSFLDNIKEYLGDPNLDQSEAEAQIRFLLDSDKNWLVEEASNWLSVFEGAEPPKDQTTFSLNRERLFKVQTGHVIYADRSIAVNVTAVPSSRFFGYSSESESSSYVPITGDDIYLSVFGSGSVTIDLYEFPHLNDKSDFGNAVAPIASRRLSIDRETPAVKIEGAKNSYRVVNATNMVIVVYVILLKDGLSGNITVDPSTGRIVNILPKEVEYSLGRVALSTLATLSDIVPLEIYKESTSNPVFFVRWHALRELAKISRELALPIAEEFSRSEPNLMVRRASTHLVKYLSSLES